LGLLTCKNRRPYNLYCVGGDVKHYYTCLHCAWWSGGERRYFALSQRPAVTIQWPTMCGVRIPKFLLLVVPRILIQDPLIHP